nr:hypothetical protein GCM10025732_01580 [Glycomyces mayteni]
MVLEVRGVVAVEVVELARGVGLHVGVGAGDDLLDVDGLEDGGAQDRVGEELVVDVDVDVVPQGPRSTLKSIPDSPTSWTTFSALMLPGLEPSTLPWRISVMIDSRESKDLRVSLSRVTSVDPAQSALGLKIA